MKRSLLALAALTAFAGAASAQSSVTLFGIVDAGVARLSSGGKSITGMTNSGFNSSRLGFRGVEDLGGGMSAGFWLEAAVGNDDGTTGGSNGIPTAGLGTANTITLPAFFNRRATVSLLGPFGEVRLGRDYTPTFWNTTVYDEFGTNGIGQALTPGLLGGANGTATNSVRANNSVGYFTPNLGGFTGQVMYAMGEQAGGVKTNNYLGFRLGFAAGPLSLHGSYGKTEGGTIALATTPPTVAGNNDNLDVKYLNFGASYDAGIVKPMLFVGQEENGAGRKTTAIEVSLGVVLGQGRVRAAYSRYDQKGGDATFNGADWNKMAVGYLYNLSKRSAIYTTYARVSNKGASARVVANNGLGIAGSAGGNASGFEFGVRHAF